MKLYVVDFETDGLVSTKIHVMSIGWKDKEGEWQIASTNDPKKIKSVLENPKNIIVGHFFKSFDVVEVERVLDFKVKATVYDTLSLAWYIYPARKKSFGLDEFGKDFGIQKPPIDDWENLTYEDYKFRCEEDVKINIQLWEDILQRLVKLYGSWEKAEKFVNYLMFKTDCLVDQQLERTRFCMEKIHDNIAYLTPLIEEKENILKAVMPPGKIIKKKPSQLHSIKKHIRPKTWKKADGTLSKAGENWALKVAKYKGHNTRILSTDDLQYYAFNEDGNIEFFEEKKLTSNGQKWYEELDKRGLPKTTEAIHEDPNPSSIPQLKIWLLDHLNWQPMIFNDGANGPVPQIRNKDKELCESILKLADKEPAINALDGLTVLNHRLGILKSFIETADYKGYAIAGASGFTNTLRLKHRKPIVNLPGVTSREDIPIDQRDFRDGRTVRECVIAKDGHVLCGSDISSLEDQTKRHYMWKYDKDYVVEQMKEGYDPHLDLALRAGALTQEQVDDHKLYKSTKGKKGKDYSDIRHIYKTANYSCIYGVGIATLSKSTGLPQRETRKLRQDYWDRNWSIKEMVKDLIVKKTSGDQMWLLNPVNHYWYSVRTEKDLFSTLNQGTGSFIFDLWVSYIRAAGYKPHIQYHDEVLIHIPKGEEEAANTALTEAMEKVNNILKLNVTIEVDVQFGKTYADVH